MAVGLAMNQHAAVAKIVDQVAVCILHPDALVLREVVVEAAVGRHRAKQRNAERIFVRADERAVQIVIHLAEGRRDVDNPCAGIEFHEISGEHLPEKGRRAARSELRRGIRVSRRVDVERRGVCSPQ